jgi:alanine racemase
LYAKHDITATGASVEKLRHLEKAAKGAGVKIRVHLKIDTGMGRIGVRWDRVGRFIGALGEFKNLKIEGVYTHFSCAGEDEKFTQTQVVRMREVLKSFTEASFSFHYIHTDNSKAIAGNEFPEGTIVRAGLILYGGRAFTDYGVLCPLELTTKVSYVKVLQRGDSVGYGAQYVVKEPFERIATLPIGYADGYTKRLSGKARVLLNGKSYPVVGGICMDQVMISVAMDSVFVNDEVTLIGVSGEATITLSDLAEKSSTCEYEILTSLSGRIPRIFLD